MVRRTVFAAVVLALGLVAVSAAPAKSFPPPPAGGGASGPTNLRITASSDTSISLAWDAAKGGSATWWYCVVRNGGGCLVFVLDISTDTVRVERFSLTCLGPG